MAEHKSERALREEAIQEFWREHDIFKKTLRKPSPKGEFVFYDGPPFATGQPHYGHILAGTMKDAIPRYKTMQGYHVPRVWGWDCHGLPIENLVEKELGLKSKKDIEDFGIQKFNEAARAAVLRYDADWKKIVPRTGRFIDMDLAYLTMQPSYSESIWWSFKTLHDKGLIYQGFKSMHLCPHCGTTLSNFEVAQGYKDITDISVYVKFELVDEPGIFVLAWTTTPWTLPGNVALAVKSDIQYVQVEVKGEQIILAKDRLSVIKDEYTVIKEFSGAELVGKTYKPVFPYYKDAELKHKENIWKIVAADFVTTQDGVGVVHIAPGYGEDDYVLSLKEKLPFIQHVGTDGAFKKEVTDFAGEQVKPKDDHQKADVEIIKYLAHHNSLFAKEKLVHSYPHCWRCDTPLLNYATSSWFVEVTKLKDRLVAENKKVHWVPAEIGEGRFGKWLEGARDWAISRSRYWGAPLPVWICADCNQTEVIGTVADLKKKTKRNNYFVMRHGEADHNVANILSSKATNPHHLTERGQETVATMAKALVDKNIDIIIASPFVRTKETADIVVEEIAFKGQVQTDERLAEYDFGDLDGQSIEKYHSYYSSVTERFEKRLPNGENLRDVKQRIGNFLYDIDQKYEGKNILFVTHDGPASMIFAVAEGADDKGMLELWGMDRDFLSPGQEAVLEFSQLPHNGDYSLDLHRPYIDEVTFSCSCGGTMKRVPEVFDTWYESGSMPYSQIHYPFENKDKIDNKLQFPANFIAEGQDQTRGWFYSLLVLSVGLFDQTPYQNVIVNGIVLAEDGQKMSKRLKNYPDVSYVLDKYGADAMRYYMLSSPVVKAEDLAFSERGLDEVVKKLLMRLQNVYTFYETYKAEQKPHHVDSKNVLDRWILARLAELTKTVTESLENYELDRAAKPFMLFVDDLSTWYLRRSRDRFKGEDENDKQSALKTIEHVLRELAKLMAPFMPFVAEDLYQKLKTEKSELSVHLEQWPTHMQFDENILTDMNNVRALVTKALELRASAGLKIRQPLATLKLNQNLDTDLLNIIADELNVKEVVFDVKTEDVWLDTTISEELKREGQARELQRAIQDMRKAEKLNPSDSIVLNVHSTQAGLDLVHTFKADLMKTCRITEIKTGASGQKVVIDDLEFDLSIERA